jgi:hypothetical protein
VGYLGVFYLLRILRQLPQVILLVLLVVTRWKKPQIDLGELGRLPWMTHWYLIVAFLSSLLICWCEVKIYVCLFDKS